MMFSFSFCLCFKIIFILVIFGLLRPCFFVAMFNASAIKSRSPLRSIDGEFDA